MRNLILSMFLMTLILSCEETKPSIGDVDFRQEMRDFVIGLSEWSKSQQANFIVIPQNGQELITDTGEASGPPQTTYLNAIDGTGRESMFYGYDADDQVTPFEDSKHLLDLCLLNESKGVEVLATDYCFTPSKMDDSYGKNSLNGFVSFAATERDLNNIPTYPVPIPFENARDVSSLMDVDNFLYLINSERFSEKSDFIAAVAATNYDLVVMDLFHNESVYSAADISQLRTKENGGSRLVICYMSIGEAEDYRYYWKSSWSNEEPDWMEPENPEWEGNYKVRYWDTEWQSIIFGNESSYLKQIINSGFDGVYLDIIDGFEYFEEN